MMPAFSTRDGGDRRAELRFVIAVDRRDRRDHGRDDVGGVEPAPESDLDDRDVHGQVAKDFEGDGRGHLEERRLDASARRVQSAASTAVADAAEGRVEAVRGDGRAVDREPLFEARPGGARCSGRSDGPPR